MSKPKKMNDMLHKKLDSHVCTNVLSSDFEDPTAMLTQVMTELRMAEIDLNKSQRDLDSALKVIKATEQEVPMTKDNVEKCMRDYQTSCQEIKELEEKVKGNMSLIQAREIIGNYINDIVKNVWELLIIVGEEKIIISDLEGIIVANKKNS